VTLRVPELAPALGRLIVPSRSGEPWVPLDDVRESLATRVLECAGAARHDIADGAPARALKQLERGPWSAAWEEAVRRSAERVGGVLDEAIAAAARSVRMPRRRARALLLSGAERRAIAARLASGGDCFEAAVDVVARATDLLHRTWPGDPETLTEWREAQLLAARRLEEAWLALEARVEEERARWAPDLAAIHSWRPALWPVFALWVPLAVAAIWLSLVLGGYLPAPAWLAARLGF
jgi:hypothetical protein